MALKIISLKLWLIKFFYAKIRTCQLVYLAQLNFCLQIKNHSKTKGKKCSNSFAFLHRTKKILRIFFITNSKIRLFCFSQKICVHCRVKKICTICYVTLILFFSQEALWILFAFINIFLAFNNICTMTMRLITFNLIVFLSKIYFLKT